MALTCSREERRGIFYLKTDIPLDDGVLAGLGQAGAVLIKDRLGVVASLAHELGLHGEVRPLSTGTYHIVHAIDARASDGAPMPRVMRSSLASIFAHDLTLTIERRAKRWLQAVGGGDLVPATTTVRFARDGAPFDFAVLDYVDTPTIRTVGDDVLDRCPDILAEVGRVLSIINSVEGRGAGLLDLSEDSPVQPVGVHERWADYIGLNLGTHIGHCRDAGFIEAAMANHIAELFDGMMPDLDDRPMRLLHGDPGNHNLVLDAAASRIVTVFDWEDALVGDPLFDAAMWASFHPPRRVDPVLAAYRYAPTSTRERRLFALYFLRIALSKTMHRLRFQIKDRPGYSPGHHRIFRGVEALEALM
jgi:aminoglycoside phosphotransferase (APT) family kinase protein